MTKDDEVEDDSAEEPPVEEKDTDEEVKAKDKIIEQLKQENAKLKTQNQLLENKANDLQAKASIPRY